MEPFLAIGELLQKHGHEVVCCFPEQFRDTVLEMGFEFRPTTAEFLELIEGATGKSLMGGHGSFFQRTRGYIKLARDGMRVQKEIQTEQFQVLIDEKPDRIVYHPKSIIPVLWEMANPGKSVMVSPIPCMIHPVDHLSVMSINGNKDYGKTINRLTYRLVNNLRAFMSYRMTRKYHAAFINGEQGSLKKISIGAIKKCNLETQKSFYTVSPALFPQPKYWAKHVKVMGYHERTKTRNWKAPSELEDFLERHEKIVLITFGSMSNKKPEEKTRAIINVLKKHKVPAIINTSWGGLTKPSGEDLPDHIYFVSNIPYDWLFPKMYAVVHHGGSGTTHTTMKYGCASLIIPHIVDQFFWNKVLANLGAGPLGFPIKKLREELLEPKLLDLLNNEGYKTKAKQIAGQMAKEDFETKLVEGIIF